MSGNVVYADSSALVKLVITEAETPALRRFLGSRPNARVASSGIATTEVMRAVLREAVHAYLFGFDAPCIAFCGIALERVLKEALVAVGAWTAEEAYEENRGAQKALTDANKEKLVGVWEVVKAEQGALPVGSTVAFSKDGKAKVTAVRDGKESTAEGTYAVDGTKLTVTLTEP